MAKDQNGIVLRRRIRKEVIDGRLLYGVNVWFGNDPATTLRRYHYRLLSEAGDADIADQHAVFTNARPYLYGDGEGGN